MIKKSIFIFLVFILGSCANPSQENRSLDLSDEFKSYWYSGEAEITSYDLEQARYGEIRNGEAVLIFVTEDFLPEEQVKANSADENNISVLKLNYYQKFHHREFILIALCKALFSL